MDQVEIEKLEELVNEVYLYCEENGIKKRDVVITKEEHMLKIKIHSHVDQEHRDALEKLVGNYGEIEDGGEIDDDDED